MQSAPFFCSGASVQIRCVIISEHYLAMRAFLKYLSWIYRKRLSSLSGAVDTRLACL